MDERSRPDRAYLSALVLVAVLQLLQALSLPLLVTYDGHWYVRLAEVLGTSRFDQDWDFLRTPLFPLLLKLLFALVGRHALAVIALQTALALAGTALLGDALRRAGFVREAPWAVVLVAAYPNLITYEHALLTEVGTFFFLALLVNLLCREPSGSSLARSVAIALAVALGFYHRSSLLYLAPVAGAIVLMGRARESPRARSGALIVAILPFLLAYPWQRNPKVAERTGESVLLYGLVKQGVLPARDPVAAGLPGYTTALRAATSPRGIRLSGLPSATEYEPLDKLAARSPSPWRTWLAAVTRYPGRYGAALLRNALLLTGFGDEQSDTAAFRGVVLSGRGPAVLPRPAGFPDIGLDFSLPPASSLFAGLLVRAAPVYDVLLPPAFLATAAMLLLAWRRRDTAALSLALLPLCFVTLHVLLLSSQDRMAAPAHPLVLVNLILLPAFAMKGNREPGEVGARVAARADRLALPALLVWTAALALLHSVYVVRSRMIPSADEAHYMSGVVSIVRGFDVGSLGGAWNGYLGALGFKPPLICLPPVLLHYVLGGYVLPSMLSLVLVFVALVFASYSLFRNALRPFAAAAAAALLSTAPMITGLTHRFYVEALLVLLTLVYLDLLVRTRLRSLLAALSAGVILGLGLLCKPSFVPLALPPLAWVLLRPLVRPSPDDESRPSWWRVAGRACVLAAAAAAVAWPWYAPNWRAVADHAAAGFSCSECSYPTVAATLSLVSVGPHAFVFLLALVGLVPLLGALGTGRLQPRERDAWVLLLLVAAVTLLACTTATNKATRFSATWLPAIAGVAVYGVVTLLRTSLAMAVLALATSASLLLCVHNSFRLPLLPTLRLGDLRLLDASFPLNPPDWFDDNHPLDTRPNPCERIAAVIAQDARRHPGGQRAQVRLTVHGLLINHDYMNLLASLRKDAVDYGWWPGTTTSGPGAPDYIVAWTGFGTLYRGRETKDYYPEVAADVASGRLQYELAYRLPGPEETEAQLYRRRSLRSSAELPPPPGQIVVAARPFARGNAPLGPDASIGGPATSVPAAAFARYDVTVPAAGPYQLEIQCAAAEERPLRLTLNGLVMGGFGCGATGGWSASALQWRPLGVFPLGSGVNAIRITGSAGLPRIDRLLLTPVRIEPPSLVP